MSSIDHSIQPLIGALDERAHILAEYDRYYSGTQAMAFLSPEARQAVGTRFGRLAVNVPRLAVNSLNERLRVTGFDLDGAPSPSIWRSWIDNDLDQRAALVHREALVLGRSYCIVWARGDGSPNVSPESAHQVLVERDPGTRQVLRALKRWEDRDATHVVVYEPDVIRRLRADSVGAVHGFKVIEELDNPLGTVPVVEFCNSDRILAEGTSELDDLIPLVDGLNKVLADMMVGSEFYARPRRWATGIELVEDEDGEERNPFPDGHRMMIAEEAAAKFGQLPGSDLGSYKSAVEVIVSSIMAVSSLPSHYVGVLSTQPPSADALRAAEASLVAKAEARQHTFGRSWEQVAALMHAVESGTDPERINVAVSWADPATRSVAQEADAVVKLHAAGLLPASYALKRLGYADHEVETIRAARRAEALDQIGTNIEELINP